MTTKPTTGQAVHGGGQPMNPGNQAINPGGQPMNAPGQPMNPVGMPAYPRGPAPTTVGSRFKRFVFNVFLVILAFAGGYLYMERESQLDRDTMEREQMAAEERIAALERRIEELGREAGTRVELDLTQVFEPIRDALSQVTLVKLSEISEQITAELVRVVESDLAVDLGGRRRSGAAGRRGRARSGGGGGGGGRTGRLGTRRTGAGGARACRGAGGGGRRRSFPPSRERTASWSARGPAAPDAPTAGGPDVSLNVPAAVEPLPQPEEAPVSDVVLLLAQYAAAPAEASGVQPVDAGATAHAASAPSLTALGFDSTAEFARD